MGWKTSVNDPPGPLYQAPAMWRNAAGGWQVVDTGTVVPERHDMAFVITGGPAEELDFGDADDPPYDLRGSDNVWLVGGGKASVAMARAALEALAGRVAGGSLCVLPGQETADLSPLTLYPAAHPLPDARNLAGASAIASLPRRATAQRGRSSSRSARRWSCDPCRAARRA